MKLKYLLVAAVFSLSLHSCIVMSPKKYKALVADRDSLQNRTTSLEAEVSALQSDTARLHHEIAEAKRKYGDLNDNYNALNNNYTASSSKVSQLSADLEKREARLKEVEDILHKQDAASQALKEKLQQALLGFQTTGLTVEVKHG